MAEKATKKKSEKLSLRHAEQQVAKGVTRSANWAKKNPGKAVAAAAAGVAVLGALAATLLRRKKK